MPKIKKIASIVVKAFRIFLVSAGILMIIFLVLAFTSAPFWMRYNLGKSKAWVPDSTQTLLLMGGGGYPSESILMRLHYTVKLAKEFPGSSVVIAIPGDTLNSSSTTCKVKQALIERGVDSVNIILEPVGLNTRHQALMAWDLYRQGKFEQPLVLITSPEHLYRAVLTFRKAGFDDVTGQPASEAMLETDLRFDDNLLGGNTGVVDVGGSVPLRYRFWNYLEYEVIVAREYLAIAYYKLKGWI
ncbi:MAG: YdcF family protein [Prolixibacteraceae bacterium]|nr:YdcF family protein [Prolixibacteraceae bacterium]